MQAAEELEPHSETPSASFARLFSSLAAHHESRVPTGAEAARREANRDEESAGDADVLSYEGALRRPARFASAGVLIPGSTTPQPEAAGTPARGAHPLPGTARVSEDSTSAAADPEPGVRSASVTLRLSRAECAQLKRRAAEAGLTVSAYIRSCTFEADRLRAQVKQAVKELRGQLRDEPSGELRDETRRELRESLQGEPRGELRAVLPENMPPSAEPLPPPCHSPVARRRWWQIRPPAKSISARA